MCVCVLRDLRDHVPCQPLGGGSLLNSLSRDENNGQTGKNTKESDKSKLMHILGCLFCFPPTAAGNCAKAQIVTTDHLLDAFLLF